MNDTATCFRSAKSIVEYEIKKSNIRPHLLMIDNQGLKSCNIMEWQECIQILKQMSLWDSVISKSIYFYNHLIEHRYENQ